MGALIMFGLVSVIAIVGVIYFNHKKKYTRKRIKYFQMFSLSL